MKYSFLYSFLISTLLLLSCGGSENEISNEDSKEKSTSTETMNESSSVENNGFITVKYSPANQIYSGLISTSETEEEDGCVSDSDYRVYLYDKGEVIDGNYEGGRYIVGCVMATFCTDGCNTPAFLRFIKKDKSLILLTQISSELDNPRLDNFDIDKDLPLDSLDLKLVKNDTSSIDGFEFSPSFKLDEYDSRPYVRAEQWADNEYKGIGAVNVKNIDSLELIKLTGAQNPMYKTTDYHSDYAELGYALPALLVVQPDNTVEVYSNASHFLEKGSYITNFNDNKEDVLRSIFYQLKIKDTDLEIELDDSDSLSKIIDHTDRKFEFNEDYSKLTSVLNNGKSFSLIFGEFGDINGDGQEDVSIMMIMNGDFGVTSYWITHDKVNGSMIVISSIYESTS